VRLSPTVAAKASASSIRSKRVRMRVAGFDLRQGMKWSAAARQLASKAVIGVVLAASETSDQGGADIAETVLSASPNH
jgi:hypothetical protein